MACYGSVEFLEILINTKRWLSGAEDLIGFFASAPLNERQLSKPKQGHALAVKIWPFLCGLQT
jgi:hypothetical protein